MNFANRLRNLERILHHTKIDKRTLLQPGYRHSGRAFQSIDEMIRVLKVVPSDDYSFKDIMGLIENNLLSFASEEGQRLKEETLRQMRSNL
jgi:hypothetical protein